MRFAIIRHPGRGRQLQAERRAALAGYRDELRRAGVMLAGEGELLAGVTLIETRSRDEARHWLERWPAVDTEDGAALELRRIDHIERSTEPWVK